MKSVINSIYQFLESMGRARAASHFARTGQYDLARAIMTTE